MKRNRAARILMMVPFAVLFVTLFGYVVMRLWNWLMPALFGWHLISFWQAIGILILNKIWFGGFHGRHGSHLQWRHRIREWEQRMTPEEREKLRQSMRGRCGSFDASTREAPAAMPKA